MKSSSHSNKLSTSGGTVSGDLSITGKLSLGGNRFSAASRGYLLLGAYAGYSCNDVCSSHNFSCSGQFGPYALPAGTTSTCATTTGIRMCGCWAL